MASFLHEKYELQLQSEGEESCPIKILIITAYALWADFFFEGSKNFRCPLIVTPLLITDENRQQVLQQALEFQSDLIVVFTPGFAGSELGFVEALRMLGSEARVVLVCSNYTLPSFHKLEQHQVQSIISLNTGSRLEFEQILYEVVADRQGTLKQQYMKLRHSPNYQPPQDLLSEHEKILVALVAGDFQDEEIARRLDLSPSTIRNELRTICSKFGVRGRGGAAGLALSKGIITPDMVLAIEGYLDNYLASKSKTKLSRIRPSKKEDKRK